MRRLLSLSWLWRYALAAVLITAFVILGRWQWHRAMLQTGTIQNLLYAIEWWIFAAVVAGGLARLISDEIRTDSPRFERSDAIAADAAATAALPAYARSTAVALASSSEATPAAAMADEAEDDALAAYNSYLARLNANPRR